MHYYNENDPDIAQWLRNLRFQGLIPQGTIDERDIRELNHLDVRDATQFHAFAGIGGWPEALRLAGWPESVPVWTGSPPCQPFSSAGKQRGARDERHLFPTWANLIAECQHNVICLKLTGAARLYWKEGMASKGRLNPALSRWLIGLPIEWCACAVTAMPLCLWLEPLS